MDYYPLIARAVSSLGRSSSETREALYERARETLSAQLAQLNPPLSHSEMIREMRALEAAIRRVTAEWSHTDTPFPTERQWATRRREGVSTPRSLHFNNHDDEGVADIGLTRPRDISDVHINGSIPKKAHARADKRKPSAWHGAAKAFNLLSEQARSIAPIAKRIRRRHLALGGLITCGLVALIYLFGIAGLFKHIFQILMIFTLVALILCIFVFVPMGLTENRRVPAIYGLVSSSYLFAATTLLMCAVVTMEYLGFGGVVIGLLLGIVGLIPLGLLVTALNSDWSSTAVIIFSIIITVASRQLGFGFAESLDIPEDDNGQGWRWMLFPRIKKTPAPQRGAAR
jgi:hypothetical protein